MAYWIHPAAGKQPRALAIEGPARTLTYAELSAASDRRGGSAAALGVGDGRPRCLALPAVEDFAVALHGCLLAGAAAVPIDLRLTESERAARTRGRAWSCPSRWGPRRWHTRRLTTAIRRRR